MIGAMMMLQGKWHQAGVYNMEQFDPDPFLDTLAQYGLPWEVKDRKYHKNKNEAMRLFPSASG